MRLRRRLQLLIFASSESVSELATRTLVRMPTGFDPRKFAAAAGQPANDPWKRAEAWRYSGPFTRAARFKGALPGLGYGTAAFAVYLVIETVFFKKPDHGHTEEGHH